MWPVMCMDVCGLFVGYYWLTLGGGFWNILESFTIILVSINIANIINTTVET